METPKRASKDATKDTPSRAPLKESKTLLNAQNSTVGTTTPRKSAPLMETPKAPAPVSSPSTLIMSSAVRSPPAAEDRPKAVPMSPTPQKAVLDDDMKPKMGLFSEKSKKDYRPQLQKNKVMKNRSQMQAGMNKFQIVFTDVHSLMNNKKKKPKKKRDDSPEVAHPQVQPMYMYPPNHAISQGRPIQPPPPATLQPGLSDSKDNSVNNSMNTSHLNLSASTDHSSFEIAGQHASTTPNGKYFLDKVFEKPSPNNPGQYIMQGYHNMPPPPPGSRPHQYQDIQQGQMVMMMSTPQHQNVVNYPVANNESSPDDEYYSQMVPVIGANGQPVLVPMRYEEKLAQV